MPGWKSAIPQLGFGTFNNFAGSPGTNEDGALTSSILAAIDAGYRHIDCAELYANEKTIGAALKAAPVARKDLFLVSKAWNNHRTPETLLAALKESLRALQTDYLDLYLIHWPVCWEADELFTPNEGSGVTLTVGELHPEREAEALREAWHGMESLVDLGLVKQIGVSNYGPRRLAQLLEGCRIRPACNQVECHPHLAQNELRAFCREQGVALVAYHPIGKPTHRKEGQPVAIQEPAIKEIAERLGGTPAQVILAWHLARGVGVIPKSCTPARRVGGHFGSSRLGEAEPHERRGTLGPRDLGGGLLMISARWTYDGGHFFLPGTTSSTSS